MNCIYIVRKAFLFALFLNNLVYVMFQNVNKSIKFTLKFLTHISHIFSSKKQLSVMVMTTQKELAH